MDIKREVLEILREDATINSKTIATMLGAAEADVEAAIAELHAQGVITKYSAIINFEAMGDDEPAEAMIEIKVEPKMDFGYEDIARRIYSFTEVKALYLMSGRYDFSIRVEARNMKEISKFVWEKLAVLEGVRSTETLFVMRKYKENGVIFDNGEKQRRLVVSP